MKKEVDPSSYCLYCLDKESEVEWLKPVHDWSHGKLIGYYCPAHYEGVMKFQDEQRAAHKEYYEQVKKMQKGSLE